ncbi:MAG: EscU/YscU/HrcU family type III secretion system export apparatus switch protein [Deltaproteobacteria bacterium]|nr:EscU/YscU/HrcU family type III secretion system export apparatus switch protein [Deltaproteobacteria bacterium]
MAEQQGSQEKTEDATPKRLREARKKGQVAKSRDLNTIVILVAACALIVFMAPTIGRQLRELLVGSFRFVSYVDIPNESILQFLSEAFWTFIWTIFPYIFIVGAVAIFVGFIQIGPVFSTEPLKLQWKRINIIENVKNMAKITTLVELIKNVVKIVLIFLIAYYVVKANLQQLMLTISSSLDQSAEIGSSMIVTFMLRVFALFIIIAIIDVMVQRWHYKKQLRMTKDEVKREYKQDEGDPIIKSARKQMHQELAMSDTRGAVGASDAVITNPVHLAVAVKYDEKEMMAPQIMAKGQRLFAEQIKSFAEEQNIPILQNVPLAWSLIELDVGDEVPEELYQAVAEVLVQVYRLKGKQS